MLSKTQIKKLILNFKIQNNILLLYFKVRIMMFILLQLAKNKKKKNAPNIKCNLKNNEAFISLISLGDNLEHILKYLFSFCCCCINDSEGRIIFSVFLLFRLYSDLE